jgi:dienelactone hydrolase
MRAYVSQPETTGKVPGVIVIVETSEVDKYVQEVTDKLAREGHVPVAPVLYHRLGFNPLFSYTGEDADVRTRAMGGLKIYPGADHGFYGNERPSYQAEAARDAWGQPLSWLQTFLQA